MSGAQETRTVSVSVRSRSLSEHSETNASPKEEFGPPPELSDRFRVIGALGRGGVGVVYRGWDDELDRPVAIKFLRPLRPGARAGESLDHSARLRRESIALAALSHPNVVEVYDIVAGPDGVGIVMELVEGEVLRDWLESSARSTTEILRVFVEAGKGLQAVHDAGLVHRDFKPANVMVGVDGRVRVLDFGLARLVVGTNSEPALLERPSPQARTSVTSAELTEHGVVMGTPAYMSPEQIDGEPVGALSDQFSYCVSLYQALAGDRPFEGHNLKARRNAIAKRAPKLTTVSRRIRDAVARGLEPDPEDRWPTMRALLDVLEAELRPASKRWWASSVVVGSLALGAIAVAEEREDPDCHGSSPRDVSWTAQRREAVQAAFSATGAAFAEHSWTNAETAIDDYVGRWTDEHEHACNAVPKNPAAEECLDRVRARFDAVLDVLETADLNVVEHALSAVQRLPDPTDCANEVGAGDDPVLADLHAQALALFDSGQYTPAVQLSRELLSEALARDSLVYQASALWILGAAKDDLGHYDEAIDDLQDAYFLAVRLGDHDLAFQAALGAASSAGMGQRRPNDGLAWVRHARSQIDRLEDPEILTAKASGIEGSILMMAGDMDAGLVRLKEAHASFVRLLGEDDGSTVAALNNLGMAYHQLGRLDDALACSLRARELTLESTGPGHPALATAHHSVANTLGLLGRPDEAIAAYQDALAIWEKTLGPTNPRVAMTYYNIGRLHQFEEQYDASLQNYQHAIALLEESMGRDHINTAMAVHNAGGVHHDKGELRQAQEYLERSLAVFETAQVDPLYLAINRFELATVLHERDLTPTRVTRLIEASRASLESHPGFGDEQLESVREWIRDNRPDLAPFKQRPQTLRVGAG